MDPISVGIFTGLVANALTPLLGQLVNSLANTRQSKQIIPQRLAALLGFEESIAERIKSAISNYVQSEPNLDLRLDERAIRFVQLPEVSELIAQIYSSKLQLGPNASFAELENELGHLVRLHRVVADEEVASLAQPLFRMLWRITDDALSEAIGRGLLSAHEAKEVARHKILLDRISGIEKTVSALVQTTDSRLTDILEFEQKYRDQVANRHRLIAPPQYDANKRVPIDDVFVQQVFVPSFLPQGPVTFSGNDLVRAFHRVVVLGQPGGGKSTFVQKICFDHSSRAQLLPNDRKLTPVLVTLREYSAQKQASPLSILDFIERTASASYQVAPPDGAFRYLLSTGRVIVLFDGLDELLDTSVRQEIAADVEDFCNLYPSVSVIVTSRERGYEQAPLSGDRFAVFRLAPLNQHQIHQYAQRLLALEDPTADATEIGALANEFLTDAKQARELLSNPLMLGLVVNLYRGQGFVPRNTPEVFQKCSDMLFSKWDSKRRISVRLPFVEHLQPAIAHLAHWIFSTPRAQSGATEEELVHTLMGYIHPRLFEDAEKARASASQFIEFCTGRAWVFTDTGTTASGEKIYEFTHRTFLEYFTAVYLCRNFPTPNALFARVIDRIASEEWDVVCQLAFQTMSKQQEDASDRLIESLITESGRRSKGQKRKIIQFAVRSLSYLVPSAKWRRVIAELTTKMIYEDAKHLLKGQERRTSTNFDKSFSDVALPALLNSQSENSETICEAIKGVIQQKISESADHNIAISADLILVLPYAAARFGPLETHEATWEPFKRQMFSVHREKFHSASKTDSATAIFGIRERYFSMVELVATFGLTSITHSVNFVSYPRVTRSSLQDQISNSFFRSDYEPLLVDDPIVSVCRDIGSILSATTPPWILLHRGESAPFVGLNTQPIGNLPKRAVVPRGEIDSNLLFGLFALLACGFETRRDKGMELIASIDWLTNRFRPALRARDRHGEGQVPEECFHGLTKVQQSIVFDWARHERDFVEVAGIR
jgi:hypothetical protein